MGRILGGAVLLVFAAVTYLGAAWALNLLPGLDLSLHLRPGAVLVAALAYCAFAGDYASALASWAQGSSQSRGALMSGALLGTLVLKLAMLVLWFALSQAAALIAVMLFFALTQSLALAARDAQGWLRQVVAVPARWVAPLTRATIKPLVLEAHPGLTRRALFDRGRSLPAMTMHDMVVFVPFFREIGLVEFGIGVLIANFALSAVLVTRPNWASLVRWPAGLGAVSAALAVLCAVRLVQLAVSF